ncbi:type I polyketide synthase [Actinoplanes teichomyceticus]|uniref:type I polyketide synthase n=1 Tax=Actinoplanes teichomyceticus TaxID=1867 RepID=UPI0037099D90
MVADARRLGARVSELEAAKTEPIAIIGMACRLPGGVTTPEQLWDLVAAESEVLTGLPEDRAWDTEALFHPDPDHEGTTYSRVGGFLDDPAGFDAGFFGISPREALAMDPQQRLMLEISWEALERAGIDPATLRGSDAAVFAGTTGADYRADPQAIPEGIEGHLMTGASLSALAGRVSYVLGWEGPAVSLDTACSSSLVALHWAAQSLRSGESSLALAGGVTVMATPFTLIGSSRQRGLAHDGHCKAFAGAADGTVLAEGAGVLLLERLSDAVRHGRRIWGLIRGSAVNSDGASNGLTAPNGPAQQRVIRTALANAGLVAADVDAVEAHGTGTALGDPIEAQAVLATYGRDRQPGRPLWLGSLKSNIGHAQAAAGVAGVIKMVMAMRHGVLPRTLHVDEPTPYVDWNRGGVEVLTTARPWPQPGRARRAGVSSFGVSGTNAHVILEQAPPPQTAEPEAVHTGPVPLPLSARGSAAGLPAQARQLAAYLEENPDVRLVDVARALVHHRTALPDRAVVVALDRAEAVHALRELAAEPPEPAVVPPAARTVFVFPGQGAQWAGMAADLLESSPVFAARMAECAAALDPLTGWSLLAAVRREAGAADPARLDVVQPLTFAIMVSLAAMWRDAGIVPDAVVGHSQGEIAAACVAGGLTLHDASALVVARSRAIAGLPGEGGMASLAADADTVAALITAWPGRLDVAALNSATSTVVSGEPQALDELLARCAADGIRARRLQLNNAAGHSVQMEAIEDELTTALAGLRPRPGTVPFWSTVTGEPFDTAGLDAGYWYRNVRRPVRFGPAISSLAAAGHGVFVEVSTHPVLVSAIERTLEDGAATTSWAITGTLRRDEDGRRCFLTALGALFSRGVAVDWAAVLGGGSGPAPDLPTYAFQRRRYWLGNVWGGGGRTAAPVRIEEEAAPDADIARQLAALPPAERDHRLLTMVREVAAAVLGHESAEAVPPGRAFSDAGFTSLSAIDLRNRLSRRTGLRLPSSLVFDHPNPVALMRHLRDLLGAADPLLDSLRVLEESAGSADADRIATDLLPRLRALTASLEAARGPATGVAAGLDTASADEVLAFIDAEFGEV